MASFVPPKFADFGKALDDFFGKKNYSAKNQIKTKHKTAGGIGLETGFGLGGAMDGSMKLKFTQGTVGDVEISVDSAGTGKTSISNSKLVAGLKASVEEELRAGRPSTTLKGEFKQDFFYVTGSFNFREQLVKKDGEETEFNTGVCVSGAIGTDGLSVGAQLGFKNFAVSKDTLDRANVGIQYADTDFTATLKTVINCETDKVNFSFLHKINAASSIGLLCSYNNLDATREFTFGHQHRIDEKTTLRSKLTNNGALSAAVIHTLASPSMSFMMTGDFQVEEGKALSFLKSKKLGFTVTVGDV